MQLTLLYTIIQSLTIIIIIRHTITRSVTPLQGAVGTRGVRDVPPCDAFRGWRGRSSGTLRRHGFVKQHKWGSHAQSFRLRQSVNSAKIRDAHSTHTHTYDIDQQHLRGQTLQGKTWWHWFHSALVQHSDQQHNILWTPCCSRHQPLRSERDTASSSGFASGRRTESRAFFRAP